MKVIGTCINFGPTFGFLGVGIFTNGAYEDRVYVHYKNFIRSTLRNPKQKGNEIVPGDVCEFEYSEGYFVENGTQGINVRLIHCVENDSEQEIKQNNEEAGDESSNSDPHISAEGC